MYGKGAGRLSDEFIKWSSDRRYTLHSLAELEEASFVVFIVECSRLMIIATLKIAKKAGFTQVEGTNMTKRFAEIMAIERENAIKNQDEFKKVSEKHRYKHQSTLFFLFSASHQKDMTNCSPVGNKSCVLLPTTITIGLKSSAQSD